MKRYVALVALLTLAVGVSVASGTTAITVDDSVDTPERTVEIEGDEFTISSFAEADPGNDIVASVTLPDDEPHDVQLRDSDGNIQDFETLSGGGTQEVRFPTDNLEPGTYAIAVDIDGTIEEIHPVVVAGYDLSVSAPDSANPNDTVTATVDLTHGAVTESPQSVEVVAWSGSDVFNATATEVSDGQYEADIELNDAPEGELQVYAVALSSEDIDGIPAALAVEDDVTISISTSEDDDGTSGGGGGGGGGGDTGDDTTDDETDDTTDDTTDSECPEDNTTSDCTTEENTEDDTTDSECPEDNTTSDCTSEENTEGDGTDDGNQTEDPSENTDDSSEDENTDDSSTDDESSDGTADDTDESTDDTADDGDTAGGDETEDSDSEDNKSETDDGVIEPSSENTTDQVDTEGPGFGIAGMLASLATLGYLLARRGQ